MDLNHWLLIFITIIFLVAIFIIPLAIAKGVKRNRERRREAIVRQTVLRHGLCPIPHPEIPPLAKRVCAIMWPYGPMDAREQLVNEKVERAFSLRVGRRDAIFCEWSYGIISSYASAHGGRHSYQRAYLVLGPGPPHLLVVPKGTFDEPAEPVDFPEDASFSETFWVEGRDTEAVRQYLGSDLRGFLLTHGKGSPFQAGPEGVALVKAGRTPTSELSQMGAILERLAVATETGARRVKVGGS